MNPFRPDDRVYLHTDLSHEGIVTLVENGIVFVWFNLDGYEFVDEYLPQQLVRVS